MLAARYGPCLEALQSDTRHRPSIVSNYVSETGHEVKSKGMPYMRMRPPFMTAGVFAAVLIRMFVYDVIAHT